MPFLLRPLDSLVFTVFALTQWRVTRTLVRAARRRLSETALRTALAVIAGLDLLLLAGYLCSFSELVSWLHIPPTPALYLGGGTLLYLLTAVVVVWWSVFCGIAARRVSANVDPSRRKMLEWTAKAAGLAPLAVIGYGTFVERSSFHVREVEVPLENLPPGLDGLRLAQVSDIHLSAFLSRKELAGVIDATNELRPNLTVVTGDLISARGDPLDDCIREVARLKSDAGIYGCLGNHERYAGAEDYTEAAAARAGIRFLRSRAAALRFGAETLNLAGVDYERNESKPFLPGMDRLIVPGALNVMLSHNPNVFPTAARQGYNLVLAGHTHGGQVTVEILDQSINPARFFTRYVYGLYRLGRTAAYVTRGIGTIGIPARIGAPPEITLLRLRKA